MRVFGEAIMGAFAKKHAASRKLWQGFLIIASATLCSHFPAIQETFPTTDSAPATGTLIFHIGKNQYR